MREKVAMLQGLKGAHQQSAYQQAGQRCLHRLLAAPLDPQEDGENSLHALLLSAPFNPMARGAPAALATSPPVAGPERHSWCESEENRGYQSSCASARPSPQVSQGCFEGLFRNRRTRRLYSASPDIIKPKARPYREK